MADWTPPPGDLLVWKPPPGDVMVAPPAPAEKPGMLSSFGRGVQHELGNMLWGAAQLGAHGRGGGLEYLDPATQQEVIKSTDRKVQERAQAYAADPATRANPVSAGAGRVLGGVIGTAPLLALGAPATAAGRIGMGVGLGAATGALEPTTDPSFVPGKLKQAGVGAIGGAAGGALGEVIGSTLGKAIAGNNTAALDRYLTGGFRQTVKPRVLSGAAVGAPQLGMQDNRILTAVDKMIDLSKQGALQLTDAGGNALPRGALPQTLRQFSEGLDDAKRIVFQEYDQMAHTTGQAGIQVGLLPAAGMLREIAANPVNASLDKALVARASGLADDFERAQFYEPSVLQETIKKLNQSVTKDIRAQGSSEMKPVLDNLRASLDTAITGLEGPGYQLLKNQYGALRSIEKDVAGAVQREERKPPWGSHLINFAAGEEVLRGIYMGDMKAIGAAAAIKGAQAAVRYINEPNRAIAKLFRQRAEPPGAARQAIGGALQQYAAPTAGLAGGSAAERLVMPRPSVGGP